MPPSRLRARLLAEGFVHLPAVLPSQAVATLQAALDARFPCRPEGAPGQRYGLLHHNLWTELPAFGAVLENGLLARIAAELMGLTEVQLFQDNLVWKTPGTKASIQWHQDFAYWPLDVLDGLTLWVALDPSDSENGALSYLPGSHLGGEWAATDFVEGAGMPTESALPRFDAQSQAHRAVTPALAPGDLLAHHPLCWHQSGANPGPRQRRGWSITFLSPDACWAPHHAPHPFNLGVGGIAGRPLQGPLFPRFRFA